MREPVTPERIAELRALQHGSSDGMVRELLSVVDEPAQSVEDLIAVAEKERLLARTRMLSPGVLQAETRRDRGCYAKTFDPCIGYLGHGCRNCGRIITTELIDRGDAVGGG